MTDLIPKTRRAQLERLDGLLYPGEGERLAELGAAVPAELAIVEIGSFKGKSSCYLAEGAKRGGKAHVYCIDPWDLPGNPSGQRFALNSLETRAAFAEQVAQMKLEGWITASQAFSVDAARSWQGPPIGLLFIDGSHVYRAVKADYVAWRRHLAAKAVVVFHDYCEDKNPGVRKFVDQLRRGERRLSGWQFDPSPSLAVARWAA